MRVLIVTLPLKFNYGGILQAYALQEVLRRRGHDVVTLDESFDTLPRGKFTFKRLTRYLRKCLSGRSAVLYPERKELADYRRLAEPMSDFCNRHIHTLNLAGFKTLADGSFDCLVVGSDQVWRPVYNPVITRSFFDFAEHWQVHRVSYAASFGTDIWEYTPEQSARCRSLLQLFDAVSVREASGCEMCREYWGIESAVQVLDPTLLLTASDYQNLFEESPASADCVFSYLLDTSSEKERLVSEAAAKAGVPVFTAQNPHLYDTSLPLAARQVHSPGQWLAALMSASCVVTDSFHGCVFSLLFHKPFVVWTNQERGSSRVRTLLQSFGLENRIVTSTAEAIRILFSEPVDWQSFDCRLNELRAKSVLFLKENCKL